MKLTSYVAFPDLLRNSSSLRLLSPCLKCYLLWILVVAKRGVFPRFKEVRIIWKDSVTFKMLGLEAGTVNLKKQGKECPFDHQDRLRNDIMGMVLVSSICQSFLLRWMDMLVYQSSFNKSLNHCCVLSDARVKPKFLNRILVCMNTRPCSYHMHIHWLH